MFMKCFPPTDIRHTNFYCSVQYTKQISTWNTNSFPKTTTTHNEIFPTITMHHQFPYSMKPWQFFPRPVLIHLSQLFIFKDPQNEVASNCTQQYFNLLLYSLSTKCCPFMVETSFVIPCDAWLNFAISCSAAFLHCWIYVLDPSRIFAHIMSKFMFEQTETELCFTELLQDSTREVVIASMQLLRNKRKMLPSFASLLCRFSCSSTTAWQHNLERLRHVCQFEKTPSNCNTIGHIPPWFPLHCIALITK